MLCTNAGKNVGVTPGPGSSNKDGCVMWPMHLFFANAKANARVSRVTSTRNEEEKRKAMEASNIASAHKSIVTRIISARVRAIDH